MAALFKRIIGDKCDNDSHDTDLFIFLNHVQDSVKYFYEFCYFLKINQIYKNIAYFI